MPGPVNHRGTCCPCSLASGKNPLNTAVQFGFCRPLAQSSSRESPADWFLQFRSPVCAYARCGCGKEDKRRRIDQPCSYSKNPCFWQTTALMSMSPILYVLSSTMMTYAMEFWTSLYNFPTIAAFLSGGHSQGKRQAHFPRMDGGVSLPAGIA